MDLDFGGDCAVFGLRGDHNGHSGGTTLTVIDDLIKYEGGMLDEPGVIRQFTHLIATGLDQTLQGHYGRTAAHLIANGHCLEKGERCAEYAPTP